MNRHDQPGSSVASGDTGLRCPACGYNLTGLTEDRCPECGATFDRAALRKQLAEGVVPATPWDRRHNVGGFVKTWATSVFLPWRLGRGFRDRHDQRSAALYAWVCSGVAIMAAAGTAMLALRAELGRSSLGQFLGIAAVAVAPLAVGSFLGARFCESFGAGALCRPGMRFTVSQDYYRWLGVMRYTSGFLVLSGIWAGALPWTDELFSGRHGDYWAVVYASAGVLIVAWWMAAVCAVAYPQLRLRRRCRWVPIKLPLIGALAVALGFMAGTVVFMFLGIILNVRFP